MGWDVTMVSLILVILASAAAGASQCVSTESYRMPLPTKDAPKTESSKPIAFLADKEEKVIADADAATFRVLATVSKNPVWDPEQCNERYAKDFKQVYYRGEVLKGADPLTFEDLGKGYARDKNTVYLDGAKQPDLNAKSFRVK